MTRFACVSDLHGQLPDLSDLDFDALLIGGDIVPVSSHKDTHQAIWLDNEFKNWLRSIGKPIFGVAGNHDFIFERRRMFVPRLPWTYLQDSGCEFEGLKIWGSPWQPEFGNWAFNKTESELREVWAAIPDDTDILLLHGPPHGYGDLVKPRRENVGSHSLLRRILEIQPRLAVFGHIHEGYGSYRIGETIAINAARVDFKYRPVNPIRVVEV